MFEQGGVCYSVGVMVSEMRFLRSVYFSCISCFKLVISVRSLSFDSMARSFDFPMSISILVTSWSVECLVSSVFLSASTLIFSMFASFSRTSFTPLLSFSLILFTFSRYSRSEVPPIFCTNGLI